MYSFPKHGLQTKLLACPPLRILPWFAIIPVVVIFLKPVTSSDLPVYLLTANMLLCSCYLVLCAIRPLLWHRLPLPAKPDQIKYQPCSCTVDQVHRALRGKGFGIHTSGAYAERGKGRRYSFCQLYGGLAALLMLGSFETLIQFSGIVMLSTGDPKPLNEPSSYLSFAKGPLRDLSSLPYKLKGVEAIFPNQQHPLGAGEVRLLTMDDRLLWQGVLDSLGRGHQYNDLVFTLNGIEYDIWVIMMTDKNHVLYSDWVHFNPMKSPRDGYSHQGTLKKQERDDIDGTALFDQERIQLKLNIRYKKEHFDLVLGQAPEHSKMLGNYNIKYEGIARRLKVVVYRKRHQDMMLLLGGLSVVGGVLAFISKRRRVWIDRENDDCCRIATDDKHLYAQLAAVCSKRSAHE